MTISMMYRVGKHSCEGLSLGCSLGMPMKDFTA